MCDFLQHKFSCGSFNHLVLYETSYIWFCAIACMTCLAVGTAASFAFGPQDPRKLNPTLISPGLRELLSFYPKPISDFVDNLNIGADFVGYEMNYLHFFICNNFV